MPKTYDSEKGVKPGREQDREQTSATAKEKKDKESSAVAGDSKPPGEEARGAAKDERRRSDERRVRNKVNLFPTHMNSPGINVDCLQWSTEAITDVDCLHYNESFNVCKYSGTCANGHQTAVLEISLATL